MADFLFLIGASELLSMICSLRNLDRLRTHQPDLVAVVMITPVAEAMGGTSKGRLFRCEDFLLVGVRKGMRLQWIEKALKAL